ECARRQVEQPFHSRRVAYQNTEDAVLTRARLRDETIGDLALHHDRGIDQGRVWWFRRGVHGNEPEKNRRGDVKRQIPGHAEHWPRLEAEILIRVQEIVRNDGHLLRGPRLKHRRQIAVDFIRGHRLRHTG